MKKTLTILLILMSFTTMAQFSPTFTAVKFTAGGKLFKLVIYGNDSININDTVFRFAGESAVNFWQTEGAYYIKPDPDSKIIKYPSMPQGAGIAVPTGYAPVYWSPDTDLMTAYTITSGTGGIEDMDTLSGCGGIYTYETTGVDVEVKVDSMVNVCGCFMVKNLGLNSTVTVTSLEGLLFDTAHSVTLAYNEWINVCPTTTKFTTAGNTWVMDTNAYYTKTASDTIFATVGSERDSLFRYSVYSSGNNNIEVLATGTGITASFANGNEFTFSIPAHIRILSAKFRLDSFSSAVVFMGTADMGNSSMSNRWMPTVQAWREDTGSQLTGMTTRMDLSNFSKFYINGLINSTKCQVRISF